MNIPSRVRVRYNCEVLYPLSTIIPTDPNNYPINPPNDDDQYINITAAKSVWNWQMLDPTRVESSTLVNTYSTTHDFFNISKNSIDQIANLIPSHFGIPSFSGRCMARKILDSARNMLNNTHKDQKILFMAVLIEVVKTWCYHSDPTTGDSYHQAAEASLEALANQSLMAVPATKSFIEELETVKVEEEEEKLISNCAICLEDFKVGFLEVTRLPCSHLFHKACIVEWLQNDGICPLCRFRMPIE
ncbi:E3 ubiquitin-protein ligase DZIP3-like [Neltuma alba]|uniref:E3 ubiquitin-protein ligase DZIP3-like n=1 Tax=Neltuma alba TaxID=207710 RepID=UPI0010A493FE|nr:E3 ubiquitin-protein ligase DZIP3-like [Prosopis alba]